MKQIRNANGELSMRPERPVDVVWVGFHMLAVALLLSGVASAQTAADVLDRASVRAFVQRAAALTEARASSAADSYDFMDVTFRAMGEWRTESVYIFAGTTAGINWFHGADREREGRHVYDVTDKSGAYFVRALIAAAEAGGGFVEYYFDNPAVEGDEAEGSLKVGYAMLLDLPGEPRLYIGTGYYPATATPTAPPLALVALAAVLVGASRSMRRRGDARRARVGPAPDRRQQQHAHH